jgi:hypothetical protein
MSDRKKKRREYKRKWMANARLRSKQFVAVSSSEEECEITDPCSSFHVPLSSAYNSQLGVVFFLINVFVLTICKFTNRQNETNNSKISYFLYIFYHKKNPRSQ